MNVLVLRNVDANHFGIVSEIFLAQAVLFEDDVVRLPHGLDFEEAVHALEGNALGLRQEEEDEDNGANHHGGEEEVDTAARRTHGVEHLLREAGDDEVPEPVGCCCSRLTQRASVVVEDLAVDNPGGAVPRGCVEDGPEVEEEDRSNTSGGKRGSGVRVNGVVEDVSSDDEHANCTTSGTDHQKLPATKVIDQDQDPDNGHYSFYHAKDTRGKEGGASTTNTDRSEDARAVVVDSIDSRAVLPHEHYRSEEEAPLNLAVAGCSLERLPEALSDGGSLRFEDRVERGNLLNHVEIVCGQLANPGKVVEGFITAVLGQQPARALFDPESADEKEAGRDELHSEGNEPLCMVGRESLLNAVVDPLEKVLVLCTVEDDSMMDLRNQRDLQLASQARKYRQGGL